MAGPEQRVPELVAGVDIRVLPLSAIDGFVFSRIDGRSSAAEIVAVTGLAAEQVAAILYRLVELGAVRWKEEPRRAAPTMAPSRTANFVTLPPEARESLPTPPPRTPVPRTPPPRRRSSLNYAPARRMLSESSISGPPPDMRMFSQRPAPASGTPAARSRTPMPSPAKARDAGALPVGSQTRSASEQARTPPAAAEVESAAPRHPSGVATPVPAAADDAALTPSRGRPDSTGPLLYDLRELDEPVDLPMERRKQILDLYYRLPKLNYYEALGLSYGAEKKEIRAAYFALSRAFHPDSMFRKELGSFKAKMSAVFQYLTEAYETLGKKKARDEYDSYLRSTRSIEQAERALATDDVIAADANVEVPRPPLLPSTDYEVPAATPLPAAPREASAEARRIAREVLERRLRGGGSRAARPLREQAPTEEEPRVALGPAEERQQLARQLTRTLIDVGRTTGNVDRLTRTLSGARAAFDKGDLAQAVQHMARASALAPERPDIHAEYERFSRMLAHDLADHYLEQAKFEVKQGKWASASLSWAKVCEGRPDDAGAHRAAAHALLKAGGDMRRAQKYAQRAVLLAPTDIEARVLLAQIYLTVGLKLNAKRELDTAAKLDSQNEMVKNLLSDLKG